MTETEKYLRERILHDESGNVFNSLDEIVSVCYFYAKQKCLEQRELCASFADTTSVANNVIVDKNSIINTPHPKL